MLILSALAAAFILWWCAKSALRTDPARLARLVKRLGGVAALAAAAILMVRGRLDMAVLLGGLGLGLLASGGMKVPLPAWLPIGRSGRTTRIRSAMIEAELDHDSGRMQGTVLAGAFVGRTLDTLGAAELRRVADQCRAADPDGYRLLEAYLHRRFAGRREDAERDPDSRTRADAQRGAMTQQEAYEILGLEPGSPDTTVRQAHRQLMKKLHPDQGGSTYLASRVNQAKDVLLNRHR